MSAHDWFIELVMLCGGLLGFFLAKLIYRRQHAKEMKRLITTLYNMHAMSDNPAMNDTYATAVRHALRDIAQDAWNRRQQTLHDVAKEFEDYLCQERERATNIKNQVLTGPRGEKSS